MMNMRRFDSAAAETLRAALRKTGLGVREIAERADTSAGIVSRFLASARTVTLPTADRLAAAVGLAWRLVKTRKAR
jgi:plasmid maintenance system antidote protein VapI